MQARASLSLERKLPLLISVLLLALTVGLTWAGYQEVRQASETRGVARLQRLVRQLADAAGLTLEQRLATLRRVASDTAIVAHLADPGGEASASSAAAAVAALRGLSMTPADTSIVASLHSVHETRRVTTHPELAGDSTPVDALIATLARGEPAISRLYASGDSVYFWAGAPVVHGGRLLGHVIMRRPIATAPRAEQQIRGLLGSDSVSIYFGSDTGPIWATLGGIAVPVPAGAPHPDDAPNVLRYERRGADYFAVYADVPNSPLRLIAETPHEALLERPTAFLRRTVIVAIIMLVVGSLAAWLLSRHITRPLRDLTAAAGAISTGDYARRAHVVRRDETGRLADAFNTMAEQVQRSHADLERQNDASRTLAARLDEANRAKADFLATMSHELRTPLNAIGGYVDLLEFGVRGPITPEQRRDLERVRYNQRHLLTLIGNILDFARLDAQKLSYDIGDVRIDQAATEVLTAVAPLLDEKGLTRDCVGCGAPAVARADRARVEQILLNLLSNSIRFTPAGGHITLSVEARDDQVDVIVVDTGIGIPPDKLSVIFEPFVQLDGGLTRTVGGTGLGLTISRELANAMGGDLTAASNAGAGARFTLTLPSARKAEDRGDAAPRAAMQASS
jgi:signal transduction histidine kinase